MSTRTIRHAAALTMLGVLCASCADGDGGEDLRLRFVGATVENGALQTSRDTPFRVYVENGTGTTQSSVALEVWALANGGETFVYDDSVRGCGPEAEIVPGPCTIDDVIQVINTSQLAGASQVTLRFRLWNVNTSTYYDTVERVVAVQ